MKLYFKQKVSNIHEMTQVVNTGEFQKLTKGAELVTQSGHSNILNNSEQKLTCQS